MKSYEFKRFYHPQTSKFVYKHKGSGLIIDNIFKPIKSFAKSVFKNLAKPIAKKTKHYNQEFLMLVIKLVKKFLKDMVI